jgi:hypothetical protein
MPFSTQLSETSDVCGMTEAREELVIEVLEIDGRHFLIEYIPVQDFAKKLIERQIYLITEKVKDAGCNFRGLVSVTKFSPLA